MVDIGFIIKLASDFETEVEEAAKTLRSGEFPISDTARTQRQPKIDIIEAEPFDEWLEEARDHLLYAKTNIDHAIRSMHNFDPEVELYFHHINREVSLAELAYKKASTM